MAAGRRLTQSERRTETRASLLAAAAALFAHQGYDAVSVDSVAEAAGRTSGAVYDHFGSKQGLLLAVLDEWTQSLVSLLAAEFEIAAGFEDRLRAVAADVIVHPTESTRQLLLLEHELALRAARDPEISEALRARSRQAHRLLARGFHRWLVDGVLPPGSASPDTLAATVRGLVLGLAMQQHLDPDAFDVDTATDVLAAALRPTADHEPSAAMAGTPDTTVARTP